MMLIDGSADRFAVLHVDDDPAVLDVTAEFLTRGLPCADVHSVTDVDRARALLETEPVACIVSDYDMPGATGLEFLEAVREEHPELPFVLYTGKGSEEIAAQAINAGVTGYLQKGGPEQHRRLLNRVDHAVTEYRARVESRRYSAVLEALGYPIYVVDEEGQFTYVNDAFVELVGYDHSELVGAEPALIKTEDSVEQINDALRRIVSSSGPDTEHVEIEIRTRDGETVPCRDHIAALPFDEEFRGCAGILRDISDQRRREVALQQKNERLEEVVSVLSHDLRAPLMTASGAAELAETTGETEYFKRLSRAHDRIEEILEELLTLAEEGERTTAVDAVPVDDLARTAWETAGAAEATLVVEGDVVVEADPDRLQRLLENLFTNAVTHVGPAVTVAVGPLEDNCGFYVEDDGPGIPSDRREAVFEAGFTTSEAGTGLGLAIARRIAEAHGWEVTLADGAGGARFEFTGVDVVDADRGFQSATVD